MMLVHIGQSEIAERVHNAWLRTIEEGIHTYDIYEEGVSKQKVGTREFAQAVVNRLGKKPETLKEAKYAAIAERKDWTRDPARYPKKVELVGVDLFLDWKQGTANDLGLALQKVNGESLELTLITIVGPKCGPTASQRPLLPIIGAAVSSLSARNYQPRADYQPA